MTQRKDSLRKPYALQVTEAVEAIVDHLDLDHEQERALSPLLTTLLDAERKAALDDVRKAMKAQDVANPHSMDWFEDQYHAADEYIELELNEADA